VKLSKSGISIAAVLFLAVSVQAAERVSSDGLWQDVTEARILAGAGGPRLLFPKAYRSVSLDLPGFENIARNAPLEFTPEAATFSPVITLPMPDGTFQRFAIQVSPVMTPELAAKLPDVKTYRARGLDDRAAMARLDVTPDGFHGFILSPGGNVLIDPYRKDDREHYITYWRRDYERPAGSVPFSCDFAKEEATAHAAHAAAAIESNAAKPGFASLATSGPTLRTYRLALAATGEYTQFHGGTVPLAQAAQVTSMNRINGVYEQEVGVRMTMVDNTSIVFTNAATDPYANTSGDLTANQTTINANIGSANYDIGHLFGTGGGGVAQLGVPCGSSKARGLTGSSSPVNDAFDIDYVAHEMGHQFGANHTFNGTTGSCGGGNRAASAAYEPGSGTTIMAYAGICGAEDLQPHSDAYFHTKSFDEIIAFINGTQGNSCAVSTSTGNTAPNVTGATTFTIPKSTPFYITGAAVDPDGNDVTYDWEQFNLGTASPPNTDNGTRPIFRSFNPTTSPTRTFPKLSDLLNNVSTIGESLPTTNRTMVFRLTARDGLGGVNYVSSSVVVNNTAGPFAVTSPNTATALGSGSTQTVTWSVANTTAAPVSCANVMIQLSTDGGTTFPTTLLASTANDGSESVTLPNITTSTARVRVECATAPFFDISNVNFTIMPILTVVATATSATDVDVTWNSMPDAVSYEIYRRAAGGSFTLIGTSATPGYDDATAAADTAYLYAVKWIDGASVASALSAPDLATTVMFTDPTLTTDLTLIKAVHVTELRTAVEAVRALAGLSASSYTDSTITPGTTGIKAAHFTELRSALNTARSTLTLSAVTYVDPTITANTTLIRTAHVTDLRGGVQ
jgi:reprolysin-like metallo-peptidase family M12B